MRKRRSYKRGGATKRGGSTKEAGHKRGGVTKRGGYSQNKMASSYYVSVDVGTGSVRAALWDEEGHLHSRSVSPIETWINEGMPEGSYEQSTRDIWNSVKNCVKVTRGHV